MPRFASSALMDLRERGTSGHYPPDKPPTPGCSAQRQMATLNLWASRFFQAGSEPRGADGAEHDGGSGFPSDCSALVLVGWEALLERKGNSRACERSEADEGIAAGQEFRGYYRYSRSIAIHQAPEVIRFPWCRGLAIVADARSDHRTNM